MLSADVDLPRAVIGGKAHGLVLLHRLGVRVPPAFVITTEVARTARLTAELTTGIAALEAATGRVFGGADRPLTVSVRSGAAESMPGMLDTVLNVGLTTAATAALAAETGSPDFARDCRRRLLAGFAGAAPGPAAPGAEVPDDAVRQLERAAAAVVASWDSPRARTYRALHDLPDAPGTAVVVQAMVHGNRDGRSSTGAAFSRDPRTGAPEPFGEVLPGRQGDDVVSGRAATLPLAALPERAELLAVLRRVEGHLRDAVYVEFTVESGQLWFLQVRPARFEGAAAVRLAVDLADEGLISRADAVRRAPPPHLARIPRIAAGADVLTRGIGASPGVASGRLTTDPDRAVRMAADGPVVLVRPETSPHDVHGMAAAAGILTARGGAASHAAVVARSLGRPAVVGAADVVVVGDAVAVGGRRLPEGTLVSLDGSGGEVVLGRADVVTDPPGGHRERLLAWADHR